MRSITSKTVALALALALVATGIAFGAVKKGTFSSGDLSIPVPDNQSVTKKLKVKRAGKIKDLNVVFAAEFANNDEITAVLRHPSGKAVHLTSGNGGTANGYGSTLDDGCEGAMRFDDEAQLDVQDFEGQDQLFSGSYKPEAYEEFMNQGGLRALDGKQLRGVWELTVTDTEEFGSNKLECFKLQAQYAAKKTG